MNYESFSIEIESKTMLSILNSKERDLSFVSADKSIIYLADPFDIEDGYCPEQYTKVDSLIREIFYLYTSNLFEEINPDDLEFFYECEENIQQIIEDTTLLVYEYQDSFYGEQMLNYEDTYKELYPEGGDYWEYNGGTYYKTMKYEKKNAAKPWSEQHSLEMD